MRGTTAMLNLWFFNAAAIVFCSTCRYLGEYTSTRVAGSLNEDAAVSDRCRLIDFDWGISEALPDVYYLFSLLALLMNVL